MKRTKVFTDTEVNAFTLERLTENVHLEYVTDIEDAVDKCPAVEQQMPQLVDDFKQAIADQKEAMQRLETSTTKADIAEAVAVRNKQQTAFKAWCRAVQGLPDSAKVTAGEELMELAHKYDAHTGMGVDEQTGLLLTMISAIEDHYMSQIQTIGAEELFNQLKLANDRVCELQAQRDEENAYRVDNTVSHFRGLTDKAYRRLIKGINAAAYIVDAEPFEELIAFINSVIRRYKKDHLKQPTQNPTIPDGDQSEGGELLPPEDEEGDENEGDNDQTTPPTTDPTNPPTTEPTNPPATEPTEPGTGGGSTETDQEKYTVAWYLPNGNPIIWYELAPGETIPAAPEPPEGYYWHPYPSVMPNHDLDIMPEPIQG